MFRTAGRAVDRLFWSEPSPAYFPYYPARPADICRCNPCQPPWLLDTTRADEITNAAFGNQDLPLRAPAAPIIGF